MISRLAVVAVAVALVAACTGDGADPGQSATSDRGTAATSGPPDASAGPGMGTVFTTQGTEDGQLTISARPITSDGSLGPSEPVLSAPASETSFPVVIDGVGPTLLTGTADDYWTTAVQVYQSGQLVGEQAADRWCGGEGLSYNQCVLLDARTMARTTDLGRDPVSGDGPAEGSVIVSSLQDGSTVAEYGPFPDLTHVLGTDSRDHLLLVSTQFTAEQEPGASSTVTRLDLTDGSTTEVGKSPAGWIPTCAMGADSVLGGTVVDGYEVAVVGPAAAAEIRIDDAEPVGCSADGRFLYLQRYEVRQAQQDQTAAPESPATVQRVDVFSGERSQVAELAPGTFVALVTR